MGTIWLRDFRGGLDTRRMAESLLGGSAILARDGHFTSGAEFEVRPAFVKRFTLPAGKTVGLAKDSSSLIAFGHEAPPAMPRGVLYQQLQHPDGITPLTRVLSFNLFAGRVYAIAEFNDGAILHYYDGVLVSDWVDARARFAIQVDSGGLQAAIPATGSFTVSDGTASNVNTYADIKVAGVSIIEAPVEHTGDHSTTAAAIAAAITAASSNPNYTASSVGPVVTITAAVAGVAANGRAITFILTGDVAVSGVSNFSGGVDASLARLSALTVDGVAIIADPVEWAGTTAATAQAIADEINRYASEPDYIATVVNNKVNIIAKNYGAVANGRAVVATLQYGLGLSPSSGALAGGADLASGTFQSGRFAKTVGSKMYVTADKNLHFSGVAEPTEFDGATGSGFIDLSIYAEGSEDLKAIEKYLQYIAVFASRATQIFFVDPDPANNRPAQFLGNTGVVSPRSVTQFGDNDLFFLDESGLRSLRARDSSNAAATSDVGSPIDSDVVAKLRGLTNVERERVIGLIEPTSGRFWLVFPDEIFVFSYFPGAKVSAWSTYKPAVDGVPITIDDSCVLGKKVYLRSGDDIYDFGGPGAVPVYDNTEPELWAPYLDGESPTIKKQFSGIDLACQGAWEIRVAMDPTNQAASDLVAIVERTTYPGDTIPFEHAATHVSLRLRGVGGGYKRVSSGAFTYDSASIKQDA